MRAEDIKCVVVKSDGVDDWWTIERAEHDGRRELVRTEYGQRLEISARLGHGDNNACIEGTIFEMQAIAAAIEKRGSVSFKRCAAQTLVDGVGLMSPRNMRRQVVITHERAAELAADIRRKAGL